MVQHPIVFGYQEDCMLFRESEYERHSMPVIESPSFCHDCYSRTLSENERCRNECNSRRAKDQSL